MGQFFVPLALARRILWEKVDIRLVFCGALAFLVGMNLLSAEMAKPQLQAVSRDTNGWFRLAIASPQHADYRVEASDGLEEWREVAKLLPGDSFAEPELTFFDPGASGERAKYYRVRHCAVKGALA